MTQAFWFHELLAAGKGPDWIFNATFAPNSDSLLAEMVRDYAPSEYTYYRATQRACSIHAKSCDYDLYVATIHYQAYIDQLEDRTHENIYVYSSIQVCQNNIQLLRGYGGAPDQQGSAETRLIRALAQTPQLAMIEWSIVYGGVTYSYEMLASGGTAVALVEYLDAE